MQKMFNKKYWQVESNNIFKGSYHDQAGFILWTQEWFNVLKSTNVIHINERKDKSHDHLKRHRNAIKTRRHHRTLARTAIKKATSSNVGAEVERREPSHTVVRM